MECSSEECLSNRHSLISTRPDMMVQACNPSIQEVEVKGSEIHLGRQLYNSSYSCLGCIRNRSYGSLVQYLSNMHGTLAFNSLHHEISNELDDIKQPIEKNP